MDEEAVAPHSCLLCPGLSPKPGWSWRIQVEVLHPAHTLVKTLEVRSPGGAQHPTGVPDTLFIVPLPP